MQLTETQINSHTLLENSFLNIYQDTVQLPNGHSSQRIVVRHPGAACILATTPDDQVVLVRQWRYATNQALLEIPAGKLDAGEDPSQCALRELAEETPYCASSAEFILKFYTAPGFCDEIIHLYRAHHVQPNSTLSPDQDEFVQTILMNRVDVQKAIKNGEICDGKSLIALQYWLAESSSYTFRQPDIG